MPSELIHSCAARAGGLLIVMHGASVAKWSISEALRVAPAQVDAGGGGGVSSDGRAAAPTGAVGTHSLTHAQTCMHACFHAIHHTHALKRTHTHARTHTQAADSPERCLAELRLVERSALGESDGSSDELPDAELRVDDGIFGPPGAGGCPTLSDSELAVAAQ